ncbi:MAG: asparagine synthase (glutamine-hydrolyzing) [Rhodospirillaceae bacterium]|nr:asparagine synthase (glutamine-hydrolyzing) [Rhodospirillaceae bacterium]|tara:strand:+ start:1907 stop:3829 length:1923 start_codon:yes stop_codon:yes gene_type:complete
MCGIVGILSFDIKKWPINIPDLVAMRDTMIHRGPDGKGLWVNKNKTIGLGHRRLSIVDLSTSASQPMVYADDQYVISFNGEIYNHDELRQELEGLGHTEWKTNHSDTEVILHAYDEWGIDCIHKFKGMFAIALWDNINQDLWLVRDRLGIKPLYYSHNNKGITFGSEIKSILANREQSREVDEEALFHYLSFLATPAPLTLFKGIKKLAAGTLAKINISGEIEIKNWWDVWDNTSPIDNLDEDKICAELTSNLNDAVKYRKMGDVPIGVFLSGGLDSSINLALFKGQESQKVKTFSIGYGDKQSSVADELPFARLASEKFNSEHHEYIISQEDLISFLPDMIKYQDEPIGDPVCVPVYFVSKLAIKHGVKVCQVGEGADELFCGYPSWKTFLQLEKLNSIPMPKVLKYIAVQLLSSLGLRNKLYTEFLRRASLGQPIFWGGAEAFTENAKLDILSPRLRKKFHGRSSWEIIKPIHENFKRNAHDTSFLNWMSYLDLNLRLPELLLMRVDKMSMATSLEARVPFLDHKFVEYALGILPKLKVKTGVLKYILKRAVSGLIPKEIINRKKQGFSVPVDDWIFDKLGQKAEITLRTFCEKTDFFDPRAINSLLKSGSARQIWYLLNFALWWEEYIGDNVNKKNK